MLEGAIIGGLIGLIAGIFLYLRAKNAKGDRYLTAMPAVTDAFDVAEPPAAVVAALANGVPSANAKFEGHNETTGTILLAQPAGFNKYGNFFPVKISPAGTGTHIEVGAAPRATGNDRVMKKTLAKFLPELKKTLGIPAI